MEASQTLGKPDRLPALGNVVAAALEVLQPGVRSLRSPPSVVDRGVTFSLIIKGQVT